MAAVTRQQLEDAGIEARLVDVVILAKKGHAFAAQKLWITQAGVVFRVWKVAEQLREKGLVDLAALVESPG